MKLPAVFLALVIFTGSRVSSLSNEPKSHQEELSCSSILGYLSTISKKTAENIESIRNSELGQEINNSFHWVKSYTLEMKKQLRLGVQQLMEKVAGDVQEMNQKVQPLLDNLTQKAGGLAKEVLGHVDQRVKPQLLSYVENLGVGIQKMQEGMEPSAKHLQETLHNFFEGLLKTRATKSGR